MSTGALLLARAGGHGDYALFQWLWHRFHWWGIPIFTGLVTVTGFIRAFFTRGNDD